MQKTSKRAIADHSKSSCAQSQAQRIAIVTRPFMFKTIVESILSQGFLQFTFLCCSQTRGEFDLDLDNHVTPFCGFPTLWHSKVWKRLSESGGRWTTAGD